MLKLHQIYLKKFIFVVLLFFITFITILYYWGKDLYVFATKFANNMSHTHDKLHQFYIQYGVIVVEFGLIIMLFFFISAYILYKMGKDIQKEINKFMLFLKNLTKKKKIDNIESNFSQEFSDISKLLTKTAHILSKQYNQNKAYTSKLELSNTQKDEIISAISHEFKNPIAVINGYSETLLNNDLPEPLREKFIEKIYKNGQKLTKLIDTLRFAIRLDENKQKVNFTKVDICHLTKDVIENLNATYNRKINLIIKDKLIVKADEILMDIAISNLIENGIKYSDDEVNVIITKNAISIIDTGIGIKKEDISKITDKFYRVSNNSWNNSLGLGLSIVNNVLKLHNFKLEIKSKWHKGSEFKIIFEEGN